MVTVRLEVDNGARLNFADLGGGGAWEVKAERGATAALRVQRVARVCSEKR